MKSNLLLFFLLISIINNETIQNNHENPIPNVTLEIPEIQSPYLFSAKIMNLQAIGNNLNPQLVNQEKKVKLNKQGAEKKQQTQQQTYKQKAQQNNSSINDQHIDIPIANRSQNKTINQTREPSLINRQKKKLQNLQLQKIDINKLRWEIEKQEKGKKVNINNESENIYQRLFGPIKNEQIDNPTNSLHQKLIKNGSNSKNIKNQENKGEFKDVINDRQQQSFKQAHKDKKQLDFQSQIPKTSQKQPKSAQKNKETGVSQQKIKQQEDDKVQKQKNKQQSQLVERQVYKQKYEKLLKQMQQLKDSHRVQQQKSTKIEEHKIQNDNNKSYITFCLSLRTSIIITAAILLIGIPCFCKKRKSSRIKDGYSLGDNQQIPSDEIE